MRFHHSKKAVIRQSSQVIEKTPPWSARSLQAATESTNTRDKLCYLSVLCLPSEHAMFPHLAPPSLAPHRPAPFPRASAIRPLIDITAYRNWQHDPLQAAHDLPLVISLPLKPKRKLQDGTVG